MPRIYCCPFWIYSRNGSIYCEAGKLIFSDHMEMVDYSGRYCAVNPGWKYCTLAQNKLRSYERKGKHEDDHDEDTDSEKV